MLLKDVYLWLHVFACLIHLVSCVLAWLCNPSSSHVRLSLKVDKLTYEYATNVSSVGASSEEVVYASKVSPIGLVALNETLTALSHLVAVFVLMFMSDKVYRRKDGYSLDYEYMRRWFEYAITAGLLEVAIVCGQGTREWFGIVYILACNVVIQLMGYLMDVAPRFPYKSWFFGIGGFLLSIQIWLISTNAVNTSNKSENESVWVRMAIFYGVMYSLFGVHQACVHYWEWYRTTFHGDMIFIFLSMSSKLYLSWSLIAEIRQRFYELGEPLTPSVWFETDRASTVDTWMSIKDTMMVFSIVVIVLGYVISYVRVTPPKASKVRAKRVF